MLSICIPIYNNDCNALVTTLYQQIQQLNIDAEIICIDDKSTDEFRKINDDLKQYCTYILLPQNIGRAKIRNKFLEYTKYQYLLFLDSDALITTNNYVENYVLFLKQNQCNVICGGTHFIKSKLGKNLQFIYCNNSEIKLLKSRTNNRYSSFMTNNFIVQKTILQQIKFDEDLISYGHEDTLFGYRLKENNATIVYINNAATCIANDSNNVFMNKTKLAINNLVFITKKLQYNLNFINDVKLLKTYFTIKKIGFAFILKLVALVFAKPIKWLLCNVFSSIKLYNLYKLLLLSKSNI